MKTCPRGCGLPRAFLLSPSPKLAGVSVEEFMDYPSRRNVSLHYADEELAEDLKTASRLGL
jgi:predicted HTH domain antitoxin